MKGVMALDRQRILNELGSVMNQLKSTDCGCIGKLFGNSGQPSMLATAQPTCGGYRRGCCHGQGFGLNSTGSSGEPYCSNAHNMCSPCMGRCNPPKLYADTYNYLTDNLMQPTVKEVYNDLKSLTPANTMVNDPMANQMGLSKNGFANQRNMGDMVNQYQASSFNNNINQAGNTSYPVPINEIKSNQIGQMGGMGPQIMNMLGGSIPNQNNVLEQKGQLTGPMVIDTPQSPHGQIGVTPLSVPMRNNQSSYHAQNYSGSHNINESMIPSNLQPGGLDTQTTMKTNPAAQQMAATHPHSHGQHSQGISKFNEMFPGVVTGLGGDLGFDPMAIAIQMNPANHQQAAIDTMHKMMQNNDINKVFDQSTNALQSGISGAPSNTGSPKTQQNQMHSNLGPNQIQETSILAKGTNDSIQQNTTLTNQIMYQNTASYNNANRDNQANQQVYTAVSGVTVPVQQPQNELNQQNSLQYQQQSIFDPNTNSIIASPTLPVVYEATTDQQNIQSQILNNTVPESPKVQQIIKEPIFPADTSRFSYVAPKQKKYEYNTLGQPVEMLSAIPYRTQEPALPQTLSPQPTQRIPDPSKYSKVKSTVSKTSLIGTKAIGRTPSQLQQIYNQYKGSQSYTQQSIAAPPVRTATHSAGKIMAAQASPPLPQVPIERIGGDTVTNNQLRVDMTNKVERVIGQIGDVPPSKIPCDDIGDKFAPVPNRRCRNGLQDVVYTSYPSSAAWSFHGASTVPYTTTRHRYRK